MNNCDWKPWIVEKMKMLTPESWYTTLNIKILEFLLCIQTFLLSVEPVPWPSSDVVKTWLFLFHLIILLLTLPKLCCSQLPWIIFLLVTISYLPRRGAWSAHKFMIYTLFVSQKNIVLWPGHRNLQNIFSCICYHCYCYYYCPTNCRNNIPGKGRGVVG